MPALKDNERLDWLQLIRTQSIGPITFHRLIAKYGTAADGAESALPESVAQCRAKKPA